MIIQIYEIQTPEEANRCIDLGVDHIGSVLLSGQDWKQPNILEVVKLTRQSRSKSSIIPLFNDFDTLSKVLDYYQPDFIHFCESLVDECGKETNLTQYIELQHTIKERFPDVIIIRSLPIPMSGAGRDFPTLSIAEKLEQASDFFLTDTWLGKEPVEGFIGITGILCDQQIVKELVEWSKIPVILAGGLSPDNVFEALEYIVPAGVDSCTLTNALDNNGIPVRFQKDFERVEKFVNETRRIKNMTAERIKALEQEIEDLKEQLADRELALPAHSIRPHQIMIIEELEDKIEAKENELKRILK
jgi:phosphoribosylanthranilate isomerase